MPRETAPRTDIEIGVPPEIEEQFAQQAPEDFVIPGSEEDETYSPDPSHEPAPQKNLETHIKAADLDHPQGSVKLKHLEEQVRALLEALIQGDNKAVFREKVEMENNLDVATQMGNSGKIRIGPNASYGKYLDIGVFPGVAGGHDEASIFATNGNLHLEAEAGDRIYLGYYASDAGGTRVHVGEFGTGVLYDWSGDNDYFAITHEGRGTETSAQDYGLLIGTSNTYLNAASGGTVYLRVNNSTVASFHDSGTYKGVYVQAGWVRIGSTRGIYFQTYGGGFYMTDTTYIRTYGSKQFYCNSTIYAGGHMQINGGSAFYNASYAYGIFMDSTYVRMYPSSGSTPHFHCPRRNQGAVFNTHHYPASGYYNTNYADIGENSTSDLYRLRCRNTSNTAFRTRYLNGWA